MMDDRVFNLGKVVESNRVIQGSSSGLVLLTSLMILAAYITKC